MADQEVDRYARDVDWRVRDADGSLTWERAGIAVLMDIRRELRHIRQRLDCSETLAIPRLLRDIKRNTARFRCRIARCSATYETARGLEQHQQRTHKAK